MRKSYKELLNVVEIIKYSKVLTKIKQHISYSLFLNAKFCKSYLHMCTDITVRGKGLKNNSMSCSLRIQLTVKNQFAHKVTRPILFGGNEKGKLKSIGSNELSIPIARCSGMGVSVTCIRLSLL